MTESDQITHLKAQLAEANEAIRELNERASSHLRASQDTIQALKLELDQTKAKSRSDGMVVRALIDRFFHAFRENKSEAFTFLTEVKRIFS